MFSYIFLPLKVYKKHVESLLDGFDPIIDKRRLPKDFPDKGSFHLKYFIPFAMSVIVVLDCVVLFIMNGFRLKPIPELFHRIVLVFWPNYWDQGDAIFLGAYIMLPCTFFCLTVSKFTHRKNFLFRSDPQKMTLTDSKDQSMMFTLSLLLD